MSKIKRDQTPQHLNPDQRRCYIEMRDTYADGAVRTEYPSRHYASNWDRNPAEVYSLLCQPHFDGINSELYAEQMNALIYLGNIKNDCLTFSRKDPSETQRQTHLNSNGTHNDDPPDQQVGPPYLWNDACKEAREFAFLINESLLAVNFEFVRNGENSDDIALVNQIVEEGKTRTSAKKIADLFAESVSLLSQEPLSAEQKARQDSEKARIRAFIKESRETREEYQEFRSNVEAEAEQRKITQDIASGKYVEIDLSDV